MTLIVLAVIVAAFIVERRLMVADQRSREREWANERGRLLDRIKPETAQPLLHGPDPETFQPPVDDESYWEATKN